MSMVEPEGLVQYKAVVVEIPNSKENPFLQTSPFLKDTLYMILFPIVFGLVLIYLVGALLNKLRAKRQAQKIEPFDQEYEFVENNDENDTKHNPFSDKFMASEISFINNESRHSIEMVSQFPSNHHNKRESVGSVLQLNFVNPPNLKPDEGECASPIYYTAITDLSNYVDAATSRSRTNTGSTVFYSLNEPVKAMTSTTVNSTNNKTRFHKRSISSHILDEFIETGELPKLNEYNNNNINNQTNTSHNSFVENHSMYENTQTLAYDITPNNSRTIRSSRSSRSPSPKRDYRMYKQYTSRSPSHSPIRGSIKSSIRSDRSPTRNDFGV